MRQRSIYYVILYNIYYARWNLIFTIYNKILEREISKEFIAENKKVKLYDKNEKTLH